MKQTIIILHGWGLRASVYKKLEELFDKKKYQVFALDLPGFGEEPLVNKNMNLTDYVHFLNTFIKGKKLFKVIIIAHSFGGRIALKYSVEDPQIVSKLILTGVPVIRNISLLKWVMYNLIVVGGNVFKVFPYAIHSLIRKSLYFMIGEWDYYNAGPRKQVFRNIIGEDLIQYAKKIEVPVLLVWGEDDRMTPSSDVEKIKKFIPQAQSIIVPGVGHKLPYENPQVFYKAIEVFI